MCDSRSDEPFPPQSPPSRRTFLRAGIAGVAGSMAVAGAGSRFLDPEPVRAQSQLNPEGALHALMEGNKNFVSGHLTVHDLKALRQRLADKQEPFAAVLSCSDSRGPVDIIFDKTLGDVFVARVAGNMITPEIIASLEYGAAVLGTKVIMVLGHSDCGAVKAAIAHKTVPGQISALYPYLQPAVDQAGPDVKAVTKANAKIQAHLLSQSSTVISSKIKEGQLKVVAGYYDIGSGVVTVLD